MERETDDWPCRLCREAMMQTRHPVELARIASSGALIVAYKLGPIYAPRSHALSSLGTAGGEKNFAGHSFALSKLPTRARQHRFVPARVDDNRRQIDPLPTRLPPPLRRAPASD